MNKHIQFIFLLILSALLSPIVFAQDSEPAPPPEAEAVETVPEEEIPASQEVEINEDNYRQFMELKDAMRRRDIIPENVFKPGSGLQKLDKLPEESQKHLRNQLREIIVQGDPWQPGDEETDYPYTPSEAASTNPALETQEIEAWGELVDSYHDRESQIYENSSGAQAARGSEQGSSDNPQSGKGQPGSDSQNGEGGQGQQAGQEGNPDQAASEGTYSVDGSNDPNAKNTAGVSQNAMEFLQGLGDGGSSETPAGNGTSAENGEQGDSPRPSEAQSQAQSGQQDASEQGSSPTPPRDPNATSTAGSAQNAMEFLKGQTGQGEEAGESGTASSGSNEGQGETQAGEQGDSQADGQQTGQDEGEGEDEGQDEGESEGEDDGEDDGEEAGQEGDQAGDQGTGQSEGQNNEQAQDNQQTETPEEPDTNTPPDSTNPAPPAEPDEESTAGASQNALEYLTGESDQAGEGTGNETDTAQPAGTLTIQDLLNAQGVGDSKGTNPASNSPGDEQLPDKTIPDKDGG